jgi:hypothetical protein
VSSRALFRAGFALFWLVACAPRLARPEDAIAAYLAAVERDDPNAAYALLSREARRELSREQFLLAWRDNRDDARAETAPIRDALKGGAVPEARVLYGDGFAARLAQDPPPQGWRLADVPRASAPHAATPEEALATFVRQLTSQDWSAIARLVTPATRDAVERELRERTALLGEGPKIEVTGERARIRLPRFELELERLPGGEWRVAGVK